MREKGAKFLDLEQIMDTTLEEDNSNNSSDNSIADETNKLADLAPLMDGVTKMDGGTNGHPESESPITRINWAELKNLVY